MTQPLEVVFGELGITQYLDSFLEQGFDTWETILDITESDLYVKVVSGGRGDGLGPHADWITLRVAMHWG